MSLFIGTLAFTDPEHAAAVRIGVLAGSLMSGLLGYAVLRYALSDKFLPGNPTGSAEKGPGALASA